MLASVLALGRQCQLLHQPILAFEVMFGMLIQGLKPSREIGIAGTVQLIQQADEFDMILIDRLVADVNKLCCFRHTHVKLT